MKLEQSFEIAAPLEQVWDAMTDVERVAPCLEGAAVVARNEDGSYDGEFKVKLGPTAAAYAGKLHMEQIDGTAHTATMQAAGTDKRGQGGAKATIVSTVEPGVGKTKVTVSSDYQITGRLARFGRGGLIEEIAARIVPEFAANLEALLTGGEAAPASTVEPADAEPVAAEPEPEPAAEPEPEPAAAEPEPEPAAEPEPHPEPVADPDPAIDGATPIAEPVTPPSEPEPAAAGGSLVVNRIKDNPAPFVAAVIGFLVALRVLRRRS